ncbi:hypothetical protein [Rhodococcus sp. BE178]|uniref:hypothetical protein n=1 Tax=Rhodococcus sp. BE178 TaxID=2817737 RepID=UPI003D1B910D
MKRTIAAIAIAASALALGACSSSDDGGADSTSTTASAAPSTSTAAAAPAAAAAREADPRCVAAEEQYTLAVANGLNDKSLTLENAQVIVDGDLVFYGASTVRPDGKFENRSDVWVLKGLMPTSSTGGASSTTEWPKTSALLKITPADERVQAVDACVVAQTRS